ncbi:MAG: RNA polymerase sigma factor [Kribbellaceae bacterium]
MDVERTFRQAYGPAVATLVRVFGDISLAEDAVQDAFVSAMDRWPRDGIPDNPAGWIVTTARNRAIDVARREARGRDLSAQAVYAPGTEAVEVPGEEIGVMRDDQLRLVFTCCHPAIRPEHQVALTLRLVAGLSPPEVARAFVVSEATMAKRLTRAKYKIRAAHIAYRVPDDAELPERLRAVLATLYLIYNAGADNRTGRGELRAEAIRLARLLVELMPDEPEAVGLLALMLLSESRIPARGSREVVLLRDQDRGRWDARLIAEGQRLVLACLRRGRPGPYQILAAIQGVHCAAGTYDDTDWPAVVRLYDRLAALVPTTVVRLNRAIAVAETDGPQVGLELIDKVAAELDAYHLLHAARATMLRRLGRTDEARDAFRRAADLAPLETERRFLAENAAALGRR